MCINNYRVLMILSIRLSMVPNKLCDFAKIYKKNKLPYSFNIRHGQNSVHCHMMNSSTSIPRFCK